METTPLLEKVSPGTKVNVKSLIINNIIVCLLASGTHIYMPVMSQYIYHRVADSVFGNDTRIKNFTVLAPCFQNTSDEGYRLQEKAQQIASTKLWQYSSASAGIAVFSNIILGSYSDIIGRKFLFLCPMAGHLLRNAMTAVIIHWRLDLNYFFLATGVDGLLGGGWGFMLATMAYTADHTPPEQSRSLNIVILECVIGLSESFASTATGYFIQNTGFFYPSLTSAAVTLLDMLLVVCFIESSKPTDSNDKESSKSLLHGMRNITDIYFGGSVLKRAIFWLGLCVFFFSSLSDGGGSNIDTLFFMNLPFCWSPEKMGIYDTISTVVRKTFGVAIVRLLQCCCSDITMGMLGLISNAGGEMLFAFASVEWMLYLGYPGVAIVGFLPTPMARSILSKQLPSNRQGAIFASLAVVQALCSVVAAVVYNNIYQVTVTFWRGAVYMSYAATNGITLIVFIVMAILIQKQRKSTAQQINVN
ncbi:proton-coupled folate transporter-like [Haliotis rufescens]|uniref:proton-coupled folate transporter-like n=1 Tax=Haliotis rufescens TaxID=6454 RepID=UPI00201F3303|nr:proton-coupled folate transporter-like [Haliotis rufescens]